MTIHGASTGRSSVEQATSFGPNRSRHHAVSCFNDIEFSRDGWEEDNTISILTKDVASALDAAPEGADTSLPETVRQAIFALKPRT